MCLVIGTNRNAVEFKTLICDHFAVVAVNFCTFDAVFFCEFSGFAGNHIGKSDDFDIGHDKIAFRVGFCDPTCADNTDTKLLIGRYDFFFFCLFELTENCVCHIKTPLQSKYSLDYDNINI